MATLRLPLTLPLSKDSGSLPLPDGERGFIAASVPRAYCCASAARTFEIASPLKAERSGISKVTVAIFPG